MNKGLALLALLFITLAIASPVTADGIIIIDPPPQPPPDWSPWLTIRYHRVAVDIVDQVATTRVDQVFRNDSHITAEGTYVFPLPPDATVQGFTMWINGEPVESEVLPADHAREIYEDYVHRQRDPALLEYIGRDAVRARIFPIPPGEERRIQLEYTQVLPADNTMLYYRYPLNTERFSRLPLEHVSIQISLESKAGLRAIYSPSHQDEIVVTRQNANQATISYEANHLLPGRDFELYASQADADIDINLLTYQSGAEDGFFLLMFTPALKEETRRVQPRDIFLVIDTSGSMDGEKLEQAKDAMTYVLEHLNPEDQFNIIAFSSNVQTYTRMPTPISEVSHALDWVESLEALGGTNIYLALSETLRQTDPEHPAVIIFLTDGLPTEGIVDEDTLLSTLAQEAPDSARIFPFGVGYDVNTLLLDQLAHEHAGDSAYVEPHTRIDESVSAFYSRIQSPVLTNVTLDFGDFQTYDIYPTPLPDLFAGTQLIVTGRYAGSGWQHIKLSGDLDGRSKTYVYDGDFTGMPGKDAIPRLWAARKIGHLLTQIRLYGENDELIDAIVTLSLRYGIITPYTSFLVEEPADALSSEGRNRAAEEFEKSVDVDALPAAGEEAVEDAVMRQALGAADAPPAAGEMLPGTHSDGTGAQAAIRYAGSKTFLCEAGICTDTTYIPDKMTPAEVVFMSKTYWALTDAHPEYVAYFAVGSEAYFVGTDGTAYHFRMGTDVETAPWPDTPPSDDTPPTPTPAESHGTGPPAPTASPSPQSPAGLCGGTATLIGASIVISLQSTRGRRSLHHRDRKNDNDRA